MDSKDFAIGVLMTTATILLVGLLVIGSRSEPAFAGAMTETNGSYVLTVSTMAVDDEEVVLVLNAPEEKLLAYRFNAAKRQIEVVDGIDLHQARASASPPKKPVGKNKKKTPGRKPKRGRRP